MLNPDTLLAIDLPEVVQEVGWKDCIVYSLGLGYGSDPMDEEELKFVDETKLHAMPAMANVLAMAPHWMSRPGTTVDYTRIVHGEQSVRIVRPLPTEATLKAKTVVADVIDKGKGGLIVTERTIVDAATGEPFATVRQSAFARGQGGFGRAQTTPPLAAQEMPERAPDRSVTLATSPGQALIYRLSGDYNPLHSDPASARRSGFDRPILHGLATFGIACRALMLTLCGNDPARVRGQDGRFSSPVFPGEAIAVDMWSLEPGVAAYTARVPARDATVLTNGRFEYAA
ncbi:3-alpha,7-alpha,12-alpha-trihydroxy-5-beta-cholest-24-enoyl-CoA hydratase [Acuticoccus sediminis]|uniref:3-alpha,7-alpha, 12-alpha-trihydroxy-5-beta-cholest-24-enoyl-CoA hydratase n=1 Tax=Acuticoccus sediminis TaxID=2184697 RepID=A0A8B2NMC6_9HYPH|nr:MaoC/PaaZ C-terminal domain-containing protein [Acuticoccus sediminis]RAH99780.1 3-alpha,7-alpha,12-alpha-trihydroxy-5-beta-cholest-24-enoyl-CoA hydratase [Acuticoccus sediminis]